MALGHESYLQIEHSMHLWIFHLRSDFGAKHIDLLSRIAQLTREECIPECFEPFLNLKVIPGTNFFLLRKQA